MTDLFQDQATVQDLDPDKKYYEELVGEGKPFSSNEALARSKVESNLFIERLKSEQAGLRTELNSRVKMEEFLDKLNSLQQAKSPLGNDQDGPGANKDDTSKLTSEDIAKLVDTKLQTREQQLKATQNVELVKSKLQEHLGPNYATKLEQMTNSLGLSKEFLNNVASTSPSAFLKLVGVEDKKTDQDVFTPPPRNQMNSDLKSNYVPGNRNFKHYERIYNEDPDKYWSPSVQNELHADRKKLGQQFFKI